MNLGKVFKNGIIDENPTFVQVIGMCPTLAVTSAAINGSRDGPFNNSSFSLFKRSYITT